MPIDLCGSGQDLQQPVCRGERLEFHAGPLDEEDELVANQSSDEITCAHGVAKPFCNPDQKLVTGIVTQEVVQGLEPIEIEVEEARRPIVPGVKASVEFLHEC